MFCKSSSFTFIFIFHFKYLVFVDMEILRGCQHPSPKLLHSTKTKNSRRVNIRYTRTRTSRNQNDVNLHHSGVFFVIILVFLSISNIDFEQVRMLYAKTYIYKVDQYMTWRTLTKFRISIANFNLISNRNSLAWRWPYDVQKLFSLYQGLWKSFSLTESVIVF